MIKITLRQLAEGRGLTMQKVADLTGIAYSTIVDWWYDRSLRIDKRTLATLCQALDVRVEDLVAFEPVAEVAQETQKQTKHKAAAARELSFA